MIRLASIVLVVRDLERALTVYEQGLGLQRVAEPSDVPSLGARHVLLAADNCTLELLEPHDQTMPPALFLRARGEGVFALDVEVENPEITREQLRLALVTALGGEAVPGQKPARLFVRPSDAHGVLLQVGALATPPTGG
jgi:catechol 2,3-dioxygenase-like lactoylglutathione lyase family enzyme